MTLESTVFALGAVLDGRSPGDCDPSALVEQAIRHRVSPLLSKTAFARQLPPAVYPAPYLRPRADTDLLIDAADRPAMTEALVACGYVPGVSRSGARILGQFPFERTLRGGRRIC
jgi:hypothetical protein